jgi:phosphoglycerate dehydrogenase-like enzyme
MEAVVPDPIRVLIHGAARCDEVPGLDAVGGLASFRCASTREELRAGLAWADVMLGWNFRAGDLRDAWSEAGRLDWIHWSGAGVDALLFPELVDSPVLVTNARGAFDRPMAEYVLGLVIAMAKGFPETLAAQVDRRWLYRTADRIQGRRVLVVGTGSIGRAIARMLRACGMLVDGVARRAREGDADFAHVHGAGDFDAPLAAADYVVLITPLTDETRGLFGAARFARMKPTARFINVGRGALVDEEALVRALKAGHIAGAALDVFAEEPLPAVSPLWDAPNLIVSPHMSGDTHDFREVVAAQFVDNLRRYASGEPLVNLIDKARGFAAG